MIKTITKPVFQVVFLSLFSLMYPYGYAQEKIFSLQNTIDQNIAVNQSFTRDTSFNPFPSGMIADGLAISGDFILHSDSSLIRIILTDQDNYEYLVCETYPLLNGSKRFSLTDYAEEKASFNALYPKNIRIQIVHGSVFLREILIITRQEVLQRAQDRSKQQREEKIRRLNENIRNQGMKWVAGETSVSLLSYEEKKQLFGGEVPNLQGFEFYAGGFFSLPGTQIESGLNPASPFVEEFSWRNRHGQDWVTPVKNQGSCGSCWAFAATGATELLVNLYFNRHINVDLSEQDLVSCSGAGSCAGGVVTGALSYIHDQGVVSESCFPYVAQDVPCTNKCIHPPEKVRIGTQELWKIPSEDMVKKMILEGPVTCFVLSWSHVLTLVGYKTIEEGDEIFIKTGDPHQIVEHLMSIPPGDPLIGKTAWLLKNSWGEWWGMNGYLYLVSDINNLWFNSLYPSVSSLNDLDSDIACLDSDGDGFFCWGAGPKPDHCPICPDEADGDDSNPCMGPADGYGKIHSVAPSPVIRDTVVSEQDIIPDLYAEGNMVRWYQDEERSVWLYSGNSFATQQVNTGIYTCYVTQTISECESDAVPVKLTILPPDLTPPVVEDVTVYFGDPSPDLTATGENVKWYADPDNPLYDSRDGQTYSTTKIGNRLWMAENLNYNSEGSCYYKHDSSLFSEYGKLYTFDLSSGSCPSGWHLSSDEDWIAMEMVTGMTFEDAYRDGWRGETGCKIKSDHWPGSLCEETNETGFSALPAGEGNCPDSYFDGLGAYTGFLTSSVYGSDEVIIRRLDNGSSISRDLWLKTGYYASVRCVLNLAEPVFFGNTYKPSYILPGKYKFYVTQTIEGFGSPADTVFFTILAEVRPPVAEDITVCAGETLPDLNSTGINIRWYGDDGLNDLLHEGNTYKPGQTIPGTYVFYVTQTIDGHESLPDMAVLTIHPVPEIPVTKDVITCEGDTDKPMQASGNRITWYNDGELSDPAGYGNIYAPAYIQPGTYTFFVTRTVSGCQSRADTVFFIIKPVPAPPVANGITICQGEPFSGLSSTGENVQWYSDSLLTEHKGSGNSFNPNGVVPGTYIWHVTQTVADCESEADTAQYVLLPFSPVPEVSDVTVCEGENVPDLTVSGQSICWYSDIQLTNLVNEGHRFATGFTVPGQHLWYVTQRVNECESQPAEAVLVINAKPEIDLGKDTFLYPDQTLLLGPFTDTNTYRWSDGSDKPYYMVLGTDLATGSNKITVTAEDRNKCSISDTIFISVMPLSNFTDLRTGNFKLYPNPAEDYLYIDVFDTEVIEDEHLIIKLINPKGEIIEIFEMAPENSNGIIRLRLPSLPAGIYYLQILSGRMRYTGKWIVLE